MAYTPTTNAGPELIDLLRQRLTTEAGTLQRGAMSRIAEHLGTSKSAVHEWFKRGAPMQPQVSRKNPANDLSGPRFFFQKDRQ